MTALARHTLRAAAAYEARPSAVLALLHRALREARDDGRFCTVAYCELGPRRPGGARMTLACGGHPLPLVLRRGGARRAGRQARHAARRRRRAGADRRRGRARARRPRRPLHRRRHRGPGRRGASSSATTTSPSCSRACAGLPADASPSASRTPCWTPRAASRATTSRSSSFGPELAAPAGREPGTLPGARRPREASGWRILTAATEPQQRRAAARAGRAPAPEPHGPARGVGAPDHRGAAADRADAGGDLLRGHLGLRQLRRGARDRLGRGAAGLRAQPVRADHPARRRDRRGARHRAAPARRARPLAVREVPGRLQPRARRLRAGGEPDRQHGGDQLRAGARARHPPAAGGDPRALHAGAAGARAAADPADHRRARLPARAPAHGAAAARDPRQPRQGGRDRHHGRADDRLDGGQPPRADGRGVAADGRERDHHRPVVGDRPDARDDRRRPVQGQRGRRPAGRHRGGRAAARLRGPHRSRGCRRRRGRASWPSRSSSRARS